MSQWIHVNNVRRVMAGEVVALHPFHEPPGLFEAVQKTVEFCQPDQHGVIEVKQQDEFLNALYQFIYQLPICAIWNTPKEGIHQIVCVSRYGGPKPEHDFIDIDALCMNVCRELRKIINEKV